MAFELAVKNVLRCLATCQATPCCPKFLPSVTSSKVVRSNSNTALVTKIRRSFYPRTYPTLLVFADGSTINIRYKEPRRIIKLPIDFSKLSEAERRKLMSNQKPKQRVETIRTKSSGDSVDLEAYSKYFK